MGRWPQVEGQKEGKRKERASLLLVATKEEHGKTGNIIFEFSIAILPYFLSKTANIQTNNIFKGK